MGKKMREVKGDLPGMWVREAGGLSAPMSYSTGVDDLAGQAQQGSLGYRVSDAGRHTWTAHSHCSGLGYPCFAEESASCCLS